jgi:glycosyltransferase involved in cell wall biosynthesis
MISVVMPAYNSAAFVAQAIESVLSQTYPHLELLVCDDGSTDGTQDIVAVFARRDPRVHLLQHQFRSVSRNCNAAIEHARYPWIARIDADDVMAPHRLELQISAAARDPSVVLWGSYAYLVNRHGKILRSVSIGPTTEEEYQKQRAAGKFIKILGPTVMFRRDLTLLVGGYDLQYDTAEDLELLLRLMDYGSPRVLPKILTYYRVHGGSATAGRVIHQQRLLRHIAYRNKARVAGLTPLSLESYIRCLDEAPLSARALEWMDGRSRQHFRDASVHHAEGRVMKAAASAFLAVACNPAFSLGRIRQRLSKAMRRRQVSALDHAQSVKVATDSDAMPRG